MEKYIIKKGEIEEMEGFAKTHFLNERAVRNNKSLGDMTGLTGLGVHMIEVPPGKESTEIHCHKYEDECVYILSGQASAKIGEQSFAVSEGDFIGYRANGEPHALMNTGSTMLRCLVVGQRENHDVCDYPRVNKRLYRNKGHHWDLVNLDGVSHPDVNSKP